MIREWDGTGRELITHRCEGSLRARASIRREDDPRLGTTWRLRRPAEYDFDVGYTYLRYYGQIDYCPYCGKRLEDANDG